MKITIEINTDTEGFEEMTILETMRILASIRSGFEWIGLRPIENALFDKLGNPCGSIKVE